MCSLTDKWNNKNMITWLKYVINFLIESVGSYHISPLNVWHSYVINQAEEYIPSIRKTSLLEA